MMKQLGEQGGRKYVINRGLDECLVIYPLDIWEIEKAEVKSKIDPFNPKHRKFEMIFIYGAEEIELDGQDRILLQKRYTEFAKFDKDLVLLGKNDRIELWNRASYDALFTIDTDDYSDLGYSVLGGKSVE
jgi:MraZ protein